MSLEVDGLKFEQTRLNTFKNWNVTNVPQLVIVLRFYFQ